MLHRGVAEAAIVLQLIVSLQGESGDPSLLHCCIVKGSVLQLVIGVLWTLFSAFQRGTGVVAIGSGYLTITAVHGPNPHSTKDNSNVNRQHHDGCDCAYWLEGLISRHALLVQCFALTVLCCAAPVPC